MKKHFILVTAFGLAAFSAAAQQARKIMPGNPGMYPAAVEYTPGAEPDFLKGSVLLKSGDTYQRSTDVILRHSETDAIGEEHFRYQQKLNNIPVEGAVYVVHVKEGKIRRQNGEWIASTPDGLRSTPAISESAALDAAMQAFGAKTYKWQLPEEEAFIKKESSDASATFRPKGELVYYSGENEINSSKLRLAYKLDLYAQEPVGRRIYFVDAETGAILSMREVMHTVNTTGTATTAFGGSQSIVTDSYAGGYRLQETTRGAGIQTYNLNKGTTYGSATDFSDADNNWNNVNTNLDQYATDAHWGAEMTYDYYKNTFGRNSINNAGFAIKSYVHYSTNYFNAYWDGTRMTYGDGSSLDSYKPLTAIDVCGHEITHGLTSYTAALNYSGESGALNEGFSDIFGTVIEFYARPATANWLIGEAFHTLRSMSSPKTYGQPDTYQGISWATGTADNGGVHTNSGVLNFWFYLLSQGGSGTNDNSTAYSVTGIGISKAAAIAYRTLTVYLTSTSQYIDARTYSIQAATDLYGAASNEVIQVTNAWNAVGVAGSSTTSTSTCSDNYESNETRLTAKTVAVNTDITARIGSSLDKDWFSFTTTSAAPKLKVTLSGLPYDYDIRLYNSYGMQLGISQNSGTTSESISYNSSSVAATYYVQVYGYGGAYSATSCYTLRAATSNVNQLIDANTAAVANSITKADGSETVMDDAVKVFPNPATSKVNVSFSAADGNPLTLTVTDLVGRVLLTKPVEVVQMGTNLYSLPLDGFRNGIYFLNISGHQPVKFQVVE